METAIANENQLIAEIDRLREQFPQTQELYREVCALLFFRYGTTPTANKLYQLVRKGSMSAPAEALSKFWSDLREKSRTRIEHPDLPETIKNATGEFAVALWATAQEQANQSLAAYRQDADAVVADAKAAHAAAESERDMAVAALEKSQAAAVEYQAKISELEQLAAALKATNESLDKQLAAAKSENLAIYERLEAARQDFGRQLERLREAASQAEERFQSMEKRSLLEIDRERQASTRLQKELDGARTEMNHLGERHRNEIEAFQAQIGNLRQQLGSLEGKLHETAESKKELTDEIKALTSRAQELAAHSVALQADLVTCRGRAESAESELRILKEKATTKRQTKNPKAAPGA